MHKDSRAGLYHALVAIVFISDNSHSIFLLTSEDPVSGTADDGVEPSAEMVSHACTLYFDHFVCSE